MKAKFLRVILFLSLCIPANAFGQAMADIDTTDVEKPTAEVVNNKTTEAEARASSTKTEQTSKPIEQASSRLAELTASRLTEQATASKPTEQIVVRIYPNPAVDKVTYTFPAGIQKHLLQVTDMGGRTILNLIVGNIGTQNTINTSAWRPGIYFVSINSSTFSKTFKLMKQ
jgi:TolA-binding protein